MPVTGDLKSGIPALQEIPAPVSTQIFFTRPSLIAAAIPWIVRSPFRTVVSSSSVLSIATLSSWPMVNPHRTIHANSVFLSVRPNGPKGLNHMGASRLLRSVFPVSAHSARFGECAACARNSHIMVTDDTYSESFLIPHFSRSLISSSVRERISFIPFHHFSRSSPSKQPYSSVTTTAAIHPPSQISPCCYSNTTACRHALPQDTETQNRPACHATHIKLTFT